VHLTHEGLGRALNLPELFTILEMSDERVKQAQFRADRARKEVDAGFPTLHAHSLLGLCGALECLVEDIFIASIKNDPTLLQSETFSKIKLPVNMMFSDESRKYVAIMTEASRATNADVAVGATRYERMLELVGLGGPTPDRIRDSLYVAQQVRNVWAHRGGVADARFVEACPQFGVGEGQRVEMDGGTFLSLMHGMHMYGMVIVLRHLDALGRPRVSAECPGYEGVLNQLPPASSPA
jgi:hypothetical protein